jgi:hypothetical protein
LILGLYSINNIIQPFVRHLVVKRRLLNEKEMSMLVHQFPHVEYLKLLFPWEKSLSIRCFQTLFSADQSVKANRRIWKKLIHISIEFSENQIGEIFDGNSVIRWFMRNTDLKFINVGLHWNYINGILCVWL